MTNDQTASVARSKVWAQEPIQPFVEFGTAAAVLRRRALKQRPDLRASLKCAPKCLIKRRGCVPGITIQEG